MENKKKLDDAFKLAQLPVRLGGLGLASVSREAGPSFISCSLAQQSVRRKLLGREVPVFRFEHELQALKASLPTYEKIWRDGSSTNRPVDFEAVLGDFLTSGSGKSFRRKLISLKAEGTLSSLSSGSPQRRRILLHTGRTPGARAIFSLHPRVWGKSLLTKSRFRLLIRRALGLRIFSVVGGDPSPCSFCPAMLDPFGDHALHCRSKWPPQYSAQ